MTATIERVINDDLTPDTGSTPCTCPENGAYHPRRVKIKLI